MEFPSENEFYFHNPSPSHCEFNCEEGMKNDGSVSFQSSFSQSTIQGNETELCDRHVQVVGVENEYHICISSSRSKNRLMSEDESLSFCKAHPEQNKYLLQIGFNQAIRSQRQSQSDENVSSSRPSEIPGTEQYHEFHVLGTGGETHRETRNTNNTNKKSLTKSRHSSDSNCHKAKDNLCSNGDSKGSSSWLEEIQFKAQYQHFRSIDYASVVNSAVSLDRVEVEPEVIKHIRIERDDVTAGKEERGSLCWNFPRVKLRRLFNAKSLDDILGRTSRKGTINQQCSESTNSIHNQHGSKNNAHSYSNSNSNLSRDSRSYSNSKIISISPQVLATSTSENNCYTVTAAPGVGVASTSRSGGIPLFLTIDRDEAGHGPAASKNKSKGKSGIGLKVKKNKAGSQVKCAKSDNCLHRIVSSACTKLVASSVDNLDSSRDRDTKSSKSPCEDSDNGERHGLNFTLPIPVAVQVKELEKRAENIVINQSSVSNSKLITTTTAVNSGVGGKKFGEKLPPLYRKRSQVSPEEEIGIGSPQEVQEARGTKVEKPSNRVTDATLIRDLKQHNSDTESTMPKEKAKLVVANVGYLQRPLSPTPATFPGNLSVVPSQSANSNVFKVSPSGGGLSGTAAFSSGGGSASRTNFFSPLSSSDSSHSAKNTSSQNQWSLSNPKCVNSSYSYNNYNKPSNTINWNNIGSGSGSGSGVGVGIGFGVGGRQRQRDHSSHVAANNANNENVSSFHFSKSKLDRHGQDDNVNYLPKSSMDAHHQNQSGLKFGVGGGHGVNYGGGGRGQTSQGLRITSNAYPNPEQVNNNYNAIRNSPAHVISQNQFLKERQQQELTDITCDSPLTGRGNYPNNSRTALRSLEINNSSSQNSPDAETEGMGDLQSPQYVKRTAHMFDSRYSTTQVNGTKADTRRNADGPAESITGHHNQPSYLSVSRSVCGYSCLSYNNGMTPSAMTGVTTTNGVSSSPYKSHRTSGVNSDSSASYRPATLQTNNGHNVEVREHEISIAGTTTSQAIDIDNSQNAGIYTQSRKSNIMEKIERLYGSNAVSSTSLWRRPVPLLHPSTETSRRPTSTVFRAVNENVIDVHDHPANSKNGEKVIPIFLEGSEKHLSRNGSSEGELEDGSRHFKPVPSSTTTTITVKNSSSSSTDKGGDKIRDDLYSKHDILNGNRRQNQHTNGHENNLAISTRPFDANVHITKNESTPPSPAYANLRDEDDVVTSRNNSSLISKEVSSPKLIPNQSSELISTDSTSLDGVNVTAKSPQTASETEVEMGKDLFRISGIEERVTLGETQVKTEDTTDGESRPIFKVASHLSPGGNDIKELLNSSTVPEADSRKLSISSIADLTISETLPSNVSEEKNGEYFLNVIQNEKRRIQELIEPAEAQLEQLDVSEDSPDFELSGKILAAIGKARLLINKKFKQFEGLCNDNIEQRRKGVGSDEPYTTKNEDLEGFWDMVLIQVDQIHSMFKNLDRNDTSTVTEDVLTTSTVAGKKNGTSKRVPAQRQLLGSTPKTAGSSATKSSGNAARDESRRKMLAEKRKAMKKQMGGQSPTSQEPTDPEVQIFVPDSVS